MKVRPARKPGSVLLEVGRSDEPLLAAAAPSRFRLKKILVPLDFSDCSKSALRYAIPLAREHGAALTLLYVVPPVYASGEYGGIDCAQFQADMRTGARRELDKVLEEDVFGAVPADAVVRSGVPATEVVAAARALPADLIVIGTHGRTGLKHVVLGSVTEHVVRRAPCPVLVVREHEREFLAT
jgi:nucleotide-binding universal stress UspA family protein